jgi:transposase
VVLAVVSVSEQRLLAVREVLDAGAAVTDVAWRYGVDRRTVHRWLVRYANEEMAGLVDQSSKARCTSWVIRSIWCLCRSRLRFSSQHRSPMFL